MTTPAPQELLPVQPMSGDPATWTPAQRTRNERMSAFLRALHEEGSITQACQASGVSEPSIWRWRKDHPRFSEAVDDFLTRIRQTRIEENMFRIATSTDPKMANASVKAGEFLLKALDRPRYSESLKIDATVTVNHTVQIGLSTRDTLREQQRQHLEQLQARTLDAPRVSVSDTPLSSQEAHE